MRPRSWDLAAAGHGQREEGQIDNSRIKFGRDLRQNPYQSAKSCGSLECRRCGDHQYQRETVGKRPKSERIREMDAGTVHVMMCIGLWGYWAAWLRQARPRRGRKTRGPQDAPELEVLGVAVCTGLGREWELASESSERVWYELARPGLADTDARIPVLMWDAQAASPRGRRSEDLLVRPSSTLASDLVELPFMYRLCL